MRTIAIVIFTVMLCATGAWAGCAGDTVEVRIVTDSGRELPTYPWAITGGAHKVYAEAIRGENYRIEVRNRLDRRVGLVIAVDGRNIISGAKSWLKNSERMYILEPYGSGEFSGWRTAQDRVNRFYFTDVPNSYASAFGDESAMGVIVVAVYPEVRRWEPPCPLSQTAPSGGRRYDSAASDSAGRVMAPSAQEKSARLERDTARSEQKLESAGTGYGRSEYSPSQVVAFEPERRALEKIYVKYEWRATLCKLGIVACPATPSRPPNRLWDSGGFAPPPPPLSMRRAWQ